MNNPPWQLYDEQGRPIAGKGAQKNEVFQKALLHAASHVWIWRKTGAGIEILLQKRALDKATWPGYYDISAAGHVDLGEDPLTAAIRETKEEIGHDVKPTDLAFIGALRSLTHPSAELTENEICFLYLLAATPDMNFSLDDGELESLEWRSLAEVKQLAASNSTAGKIVPHEPVYFDLLFNMITQAANR